MKNKGFTLVELLAVIAILAILVIIALPNVLKMFNDSKKNSFLTEAKTVYSEVSKKYISESMKGNKLTYVSSEDDTKLDMTGKKLQYCVLLNADGSVKSMKVSNGTWIAELSGNKKITDLKSSDLKDGNLDNEECGPKKPKTFKEDDWDTIASVAKSCTENPESCPYSVGNEKEVDLGTYGKHKVRIANMSTPKECKSEDFSQSACGFVVEFVDIIAEQPMNASTHSNAGGWPASDMYNFLNDENKSDSIINALPSDLKSLIINTNTISGHGWNDKNNFTSTDKLYLLASAEIWKWKNESIYDSLRDKTRQLDYYENKKVDFKNYEEAKKNNVWWLRSPNSYHYSNFCHVGFLGNEDVNDSNEKSGVSPAFRIG